MRLTIDNFDNAGARDYTANLDSERTPLIHRALNRPSRLELSLVAPDPGFVVPASGARIVLEYSDGTRLFTGYLTSTPDYEYLGWGERGVMYRYAVSAISDEFLLDRKTLPDRAPFVQRGAGDILAQLTSDLLPGAFNTWSIEQLETLPSYTTRAFTKWSEHAATLALLARASYRAHDSRIFFSSVGKNTFALDESSPNFCPDGLKLHAPDLRVNDVTVLGRMEPGPYVKDYFLGDGVTFRFQLEDAPSSSFNSVIAEDEFAGTALDTRLWSVSDPSRAISVSGGKLRVAGGNGIDGATVVTFAESVELGGALVIQHGETEFTGASSGVIGGLYNGMVDTAHCVAGFRVIASGAQSVISALVNGIGAGTGITTQSGHKYALTTRLRGTAPFRSGQPFHSSQHSAGNAQGGATIPADVHVILELHDIDPANPGTQAEPSVILYEGTLSNAAATCKYALVNSTGLRCNVAFARILRGADAEVASTIPGQSRRTRLLGALSEGAECRIATGGSLSFFPQYAPAPNEAIRASYRGTQRSMARIQNTSSIASLARGTDDGVRASLRTVVWPVPRTAAECENAAKAVLDDSVLDAWSGEYTVWSDFLPGGARDMFPGDALAITAPSRGSTFTAIVREVELELLDPANDRARFNLRFANEAAEPLAFDFDPAHLSEPIEPVQTVPVAGAVYTADVPAADITSITATTVTFDAGLIPVAGGGIEVRRSDASWGMESDRNLVGRFTAQTFTLPRLTSSQTWYVRQYDAASPPRYSRYSTVLHVDYP